MNILAPSFFIGSSLFLLETRTCLKPWMTSNFSQIRLLTAELPAIERLKNQSTGFIFDWIFFILANNKDNHTVSSSARLDNGLQS